jgi:hypothetical protein
VSLEHQYRWRLESQLDEDIVELADRCTSSLLRPLCIRITHSEAELFRWVPSIYSRAMPVWKGGTLTGHIQPATLQDFEGDRDSRVGTAREK